MKHTNSFSGPKTAVLFAGMLAVFLLLAVCTTANAKGEVGSTRYTVQQLQQLVNEAYAKFKNVKDGCYWVEIRDDNKLTYNLVEVDQFELQRINVTHRE